MSVGGVDKNRSTEVDVRNRQDSARKEVETAKRHSNEISRLRQEQYEKIQELQELQQKALEEQREAYKSSITERDLQYQKEVEDLREMNRQRLMSVASAQEEKLAKVRESTQGDLGNQKRISDQQIKVLKETFSSEIEGKDKSYREALERTKAMQTEGMARDRDGMSAQHKAKELALRSAYEGDVERLNDQARELRRSKDAQETELKTEVFRTKNNMSDNFAYQLSRERKVNNDQSTAARDAYSAALDAQRDRHKAALDEQQELSKSNYEGFKEDTGARQEGRIQSLERKLIETKNSNSDRSVELKRLNDLEKKHLLEGMRNNLNASESQRQLALDDMKQKTAGELKRVAESNSKTLHAMDVNAKESSNLDRMRAEEEKSQMSIALNGENQKLRNQSETRYKQMKESFEKNQAILADIYRGNLLEMQKAYDESLLETRMNGQTERNAIVERLTKQLREIELKAAEKIQLQAVSFERKLADVKSDQIKNVDSLRKDYDTRIKNNQALSVQELANQKLKYETQLTQMKDNYEKRIREMQQNFEMERIQSAKATS